MRDYTVIRAPFAGVVTEKYARVGQKVIEDRAEPLFKVTASEPLLARVYLPEEDLLTVKRGDPVEVALDRFPRARGDRRRSQFISPTVDAASGTFQVIVQVRRDPALPELRPGVAVEVRFRPRRLARNDAQAGPRSSRRLRDAIDRVLIHDIKNMGFRLQMLRSNLDEHYGEPEFKRSVAGAARRHRRQAGRRSSAAGRRTRTPFSSRSALDLNGLVREVAGRPTRRGGRRRRARGRSGPAVVSRSGELPPVWGDPYYLRDALASLVDNALEAAGARGQGPRPQLPDRKPRPAPRANIEIIDNGPGMSAEFVRDRLFRPFQTTKSDGVGLGLFTANQIVRHHGGTVRVLRSRPGEGTVVRLSFPAVRSRVVTARRRRPAADPDRRGRSVPPRAARLGRSRARSRSLERRDADGGARASGIASRTSISSTCGCRRRNTVEEGFGLLREVRRRDPDATVVVMSGETDRREALRAVELGAFDFFRKPVDAAELLVILTRALERRRLRLREPRAAARGEGARPVRPAGGRRARRCGGSSTRSAASRRRTRRSCIVGESGTGKELVAHAIHDGSAARGTPLRRRQRGGAAGVARRVRALRAREGRLHRRRLLAAGPVRARAGGTLFLDEVGTLSPAHPGEAPARHRARRDRAGRRAAARFPWTCGWSPRPTRTWRRASRAARFREDLYYRINTVPIRIPPLRERLEDLALALRALPAKYGERHGGPAAASPADVLERARGSIPGAATSASSST